MERDDDAPLRRAKVLTVSRDEHRQLVLRRLIDGADDLEDQGNVQSLLQVERFLSNDKPQIVVLDSPSLGEQAQLVLDAIQSARIRHVLVFSDEERRSDRSALPVSILDHEDPRRLDAVRIRLSLFASRYIRGPRRLSSTSLRAATAAAVARSGSIREPVRRIVDAPLELIVVFGGQGARAPAEGILRSASRLGVPTILAVDDDTPLDITSLLATAKVPVHPLEESLMLKRLPHAVLIPTRPRGLFFDSTSVCISRVEADDLSGPIASLASLGNVAACVLLAGADEALSSSLGAVGRAGLASFALRPKLGGTSPAIETALKNELAQPLSFGELTWMIENAVPVRE